MSSDDVAGASPPATIDEVHEREWGRLVAILTRRFGNLDLAEDAAGEAFVAAVEHWQQGPPANPGGWLMTTASRRAIDRLRRDARAVDKYSAAVVLGMAGAAPTRSTDLDERESGEGPMGDDRLRLIFTCCHPALGHDAQVALTLRMLGGLTVADISRGLMKSEVAVGQRITRAKAKIASARIPYRIPDEEELPDRLDAVLSVLYLIFNEGYLPGSGAVLRQDLTAEAIRLTRLLCELLPDAGEAAGLLALMLMTDARRSTRVSADGILVVLADQDRSGWDRTLIAEGHAIVRELISTGRPPGRYQLQAAINAVHTYATDIRETDWEQLATLYAQLFAIDPSPVVALNRAVVQAELDGPAVALAEVERLALEDYHAWHATRAELLRRLGRSLDSRAAYEAAIRTASNPAEIRHLELRLGSLAI